MGGISVYTNAYGLIENRFFMRYEGPIGRPENKVSWWAVSGEVPKDGVSWGRYWRESAERERHAPTR